MATAEAGINRRKDDTVVAMAVEAGHRDHIDRTLAKRYLERIAQAKRIYEAENAKKIHILGNLPNEGWSFYNAPLEETNPEIGRPIGYFNENSPVTFHGLGRFSTETFKKEISRFRSSPENRDKKVMILDAFGQGTPFAGIADETVATTLTKNRRDIPHVTEFNGDALNKIVSEKVFAHLRSRIREGFALRASFFRPGRGLQGVTRNLYVIHTLYEHLRSIYELTDEGGLLFIYTYGPEDDIYFLRKILTSEGHEGIMTTDDKLSENQRMLLRKDSSMCAALPPISEIAIRHPDIIKRLLDFDESWLVRTKDWDDTD